MSDTLVRPDAVIDAPPTAPEKPDNCLYCGAHYGDGPEGAHDPVTGAGWQKIWHCWRCGFDPNRPSVMSGGGPTPAGFGVPAAFAQQLAAEVHSALGLNPGENLGDVIRTIRSAQPAVAEGSA